MCAMVFRVRYNVHTANMFRIGFSTQMWVCLCAVGGVAGGGKWEWELNHRRIVCVKSHIWFKSSSFTHCGCRSSRKSVKYRKRILEDFLTAIERTYAMRGSQNVLCCFVGCYKTRNNNLHFIYFIKSACMKWKHLLRKGIYTLNTRHTNSVRLHDHSMNNEHLVTFYTQSFSISASIRICDVLCSLLHTCTHTFAPPLFKLEQMSKFVSNTFISRCIRKIPKRTSSQRTNRCIN